MQAFSQGQHEFLASLLNVVIVKLRYDEDTEWSDDQDEPEEEALFFEMRKVRLGRMSLTIFVCTKQWVYGRICAFSQNTLP